MKKGYSLKLFKELDNDKNEVYVVSGFQGFGAVGFLATRYIVSKLGMELIGYIETPWIPDFTSVEEYGLSMPHEIFWKDVDDHRRVFAVLNRINPDKRFMSSFVNEFISFIKKVKCKNVLLFGGLDTRLREGEEEYRWLKTSAYTKSLDAPYFIKGAYVVGPLASLLIALEQNAVPAIVVLPYTQPETVDHKAAAVAVRVFSKMLNIEIDVEELLRYVEKVEELERMIQDVYEQQFRRRETVMHT